MIFDGVCIYLGQNSGEKNGKVWYRFSLLSEHYVAFSIYSSTPPTSGIKPGDHVDCKFKISPDNKTSLFRLQLLSMTLNEDY